MDLIAVARIAVRALARNKMRSSLTMLGIIIGVGAVIAMVGVGQGAQQQVQQQIAAMGSNILFVGSGTVTRGGTHMGWGATKTLVYADMLAILRECPAVKAAAPGSNTSTQVVFGNDNWATRINGTEPQYFDIRNWPFQEGTAFTQQDVEMADECGGHRRKRAQESVRSNRSARTNHSDQESPFQGRGRARSKGDLSGNGR